MNKKKINKIVLAFSGGLDTSVILKWLQEKYLCDVVTFTADIGQGEEIKKAKIVAEKLGVKEIFVEDLREEFVRDFVFPMFRSNAIYEGNYLLGTAIARPLIAKKQIEVAKKVEANCVSHGSTGKGNDQIRFELGYYSQNPNIIVVAPWRTWELNSRQELLSFAKKNNIQINDENENTPPYSMDANLLHTSYEGKSLEDPWERNDDRMFTRTVSVEDAPDKPEELTIDFEKGDPVSIDGKKNSPAKLLQILNDA